MKVLVILLGVVAVASAVGVGERVCVDENSGDQICCPGWTGSVYDECPTPVCKESCERHGGTCVSPNLCMDCPGDRFGINCERSRCEQERKDHEDLSWADRRQMLKPTCLPDGSYTLLQCNRGTDMCHCADRWTGEPHVETYTRGVPDCRDHYVEESPLFSHKEVRPIESSEESNSESSESAEAEPEPDSPPCSKAHKEWAALGWRSIITKEPQCTEDGFYATERCDYLRGYCVCIDRFTGRDIEYSKVYSAEIDCTDIAIPEPEPEAEPTDDQSVSQEGCVDTQNGKYYSPYKSFYRDCNLCICHGMNLIQCTTRDCTTDSCHLGEINKVVEHVHMGQCHSCICNHGVYECEMADCGTLDNPGEMENVAFCDNKPPMTHYYDECNSCFCGNDGNAMCTLLGCYKEAGSCYSNGDHYQNGETFTEGCDTFQCVDGELTALEHCADTMVDMVLTQEKPETACTYAGEEFYNGESMLLGYKMCKCEKFDWDCQLMMEM